MNISSCPTLAEAVGATRLNGNSTSAPQQEVTYACLPDHVLRSGNLSLTCREDNENATWSGSPPQCCPVEGDDSLLLATVSCGIAAAILVVVTLLLTDYALYRRRRARIRDLKYNRRHGGFRPKAFFIGDGQVARAALRATKQLLRLHSRFKVKAPGGEDTDSGGRRGTKAVGQRRRAVKSVAVQTYVDGTMLEGDSNANATPDGRKATKKRKGKAKTSATDILKSSSLHGPLDAHAHADDDWNGVDVCRTFPPLVGGGHGGNGTSGVVENANPAVEKYCISDETSPRSRSLPSVSGDHGNTHQIRIVDPGGQISMREYPSEALHM